MMTQLLSIGTAQVDTLAYAELELEKNTFATLSHTTESILDHAFYLAQEKQTLSKKEYRQLLQQEGWDGEDKKYLKLAATFTQFSPQDLAEIEPDTLFRLSKNSKKYQIVIDQLQSGGEITQQRVRELIKQQRKPRTPKPEEPSIWRHTENGGRYCQIPPIHDQATGAALQNMMDSEGLTAQAIVTEAIALRQAYKEGRLCLVDDTSQDENPSSSTNEVLNDDGQNFKVGEDCSTDNFPQSTPLEDTITSFQSEECESTTNVNVASSTVIFDASACAGVISNGTVNASVLHLEDIICCSKTSKDSSAELELGNLKQPSSPIEAVRLESKLKDIPKRHHQANIATSVVLDTGVSLQGDSGSNSASKNLFMQVMSGNLKRKSQGKKARCPKGMPRAASPFFH